MRVVDLACAFYIIYTTDDDLITYIYIYIKLVNHMRNCFFAINCKSIIVINQNHPPR